MKDFLKPSFPTFLFTILCFCFILEGKAQKIEKAVEPFDKLIVSPKINVILIKGEKEHVQLSYFGVEEDEINVKVKGRTLKLYLDNARVHDKRVPAKDRRYGKVSIYENVEVNAVISYKHLKSLQIRGEQKVVCSDPLKSEKFRIKLYGESQVKLASLETSKLKASLLGQNDLTINAGDISSQILRLMGENVINTQRVTSNYAKATSYGESKVFLNSSDLFKVTAFGESEIYYAGDATLLLGLVLGDNHIGKIR